jgi:7-keto-8-aminopelargonate synthetase-like enzyme
MISARIKIDGRDYLNFFGSGYLALSNIPEIRAAVAKVLSQDVPFSQQIAAALLGGVDPIFRNVEQAVASMLRSESAIYFCSGYLIGAVSMTRLDGLFDVILIDEHAHFNLADAAKLSGHQTLTFPHCDADALRDILMKRALDNKRPLVITDGVFATTGRVPPLRDYVEILEARGGQLLVDESHAFGVVGDEGRGAAEYCSVERLSTIGSTLSKALCAQGAFVPCSSRGAERVRALPPLRGSNAGSPLSAVASLASLDYLAKHPEFRRELSEKACYLRKLLRAAGIDVIESPAPIVSFQVGGQQDMISLQRRLFDKGIFIHYSTYIGAGPDGILRCALFRDHSRGDIDTLVSEVSR